MKNISELQPKEAVVFKSGTETLVLTEGLKVNIITDGSEFDENITCIIDYVTVDELGFDGEEYSHGIPWDYIKEISVVE